MSCLHAALSCRTRNFALYDRDELPNLIESSQEGPDGDGVSWYSRFSASFTGARTQPGIMVDHFRYLDRSFSTGRVPKQGLNRFRQAHRMDTKRCRYNTHTMKRRQGEMMYDDNM
jgi:hypothetical protein